MSSSAAPATRLSPSTTLSPKMCDRGRTPNTTSSGPCRRPGWSWHCSRFETRLPWVSMAAFGEPAVPLVKMRTARSLAVALHHRDRVSGQQVVEPHHPAVLAALARDHVLQGRQAGAVERGHGRLAARPGDHGAGADGRELTLDLGQRARGVQRHGHEPGAEDGQVRHDEVPVVGGHDADAVAGLEAQRRQTASQAGHLTAQVAVGRGLAAGQQGHRRVRVGVDDRGQVHLGQSSTGGPAVVHLATARRRKPASETVHDDRAFSGPASPARALGDGGRRDLRPDAVVQQRRGAGRPHPRGPAGRGAGSPRAQRRRQDHDGATAQRDPATGSRPSPGPGPRSHRRSQRGAAPHGCPHRARRARRTTDGTGEPGAHRAHARPRPAQRGGPHR